ncbi:MAG TPA: tetratricopeptide repeat protein [Urbifossiella sp.]|jgi:hypothetical protein|nr:tetratricopeptide repeat protein [Urbifossiella sp.]
MRCRIPLAAGLFVATVSLCLAQQPDDLVRRANAAVLAGDPAAAEPLYAAAAERTADPGLVAYNTAAVRFGQGRFYDAEVLYARTLDDRACPPPRVAKAWFNRGVCLLRRGGEPAAFRSAVACFERCLEAPGADDPLKADARRLLELAKLLWADAARKAARPENPNTPAPEEAPDPPQPPPGGLEPDPRPDPNGKDGPPTPADPKLTRQPGVLPTKDPGAKAAEQAAAGVSPKLQPLANDDTARPLSPEDTRAYLRQTEERLRRERQGLLRAVAGPGRPDVKDW